MEDERIGMPLVIVGCVIAAIGPCVAGCAENPVSRQPARRHSRPVQEHGVPLPGRHMHRDQHRPDYRAERGTALVQTVGVLSLRPHLQLERIRLAMLNLDDPKSDVRTRTPKSLVRQFQ